jgi:hypothetical protein
MTVKQQIRDKRLGQKVFRPVLKSGKFKGLPKCVVKDCMNPGQNTGNRRKDGTIIYRSKCKQHHYESIAKSHGISVTKLRHKIVLKIARKQGFETVTDYLNSKHPYRNKRLDYCENVDGRLGFVCTTTITDKCMLEVDHINNIHKDNHEKNYQTLCSCCHRYKTRYFGHSKNLKYMKKVLSKNAAKFSKSKKKGRK